MSPQFPDRLPEDVTIGADLDLDTEELIGPSGQRLTTQRAEELTARLVGLPDRPTRSPDPGLYP